MGLNYNPAAVIQGLVMYMDITNTRSYSGSGNTIYNLANSGIAVTIVSGATYDTISCKNLLLNGSSGYLTSNDTSLNFGTNDFTIQTTLKLNGYSNGFTGAYNAIVCAGSNLSSSILQVGGTASSYNQLGLWNQPTSSFDAVNYSFSTNKIYNLTVTKNTSLVEFFVDGVSIGTTTSNKTYDFTGNGFAIGRWYYPGNEQYLKGNIYDFKAYNRALTNDEIVQNYNASKGRYITPENIVTNGLVLNIDPANSSSYSGVGNTIYDLAGFGNTGTLTNGPTFSALNGGSIVFDGSNDYVTIGDKLDLGLASYTFSCWFKLNSVSGYQCIFSKSIADYATNRYALYIDNNKLKSFMQGDLSSGDVDFSSTLTLSTGTWYHITSVYDRSGTLKLYVNGSLDSSGTISQWQSVNIQSTYTFKIGSYANPGDTPSFFTNGNITSFLAYNRALSATEVMQNYNATKGRFGL